jgi:MFS family permease
MAIAALTTAAAGLSRTYTQLLVLRSAGGIGSAMFTVAAVALLFRVTPAHLRAQAQSLYQGGFLIGGIAGPAVGGLLASISLRAPFFAYAVGLGLTVLVAIRYLPADHPKARQHQQDHEQTLSLAQAMRLTPYITALICSFATGWVIFGTRSAITPLFVTESLHEKPSWAGVAFAVSAIAQASLLIYAGRHADHVGRRSALLIGNSLQVVGLAMIAFSTHLPLFPRRHGGERHRRCLLRRPRGCAGRRRDQGQRRFRCRRLPDGG